MIVYMLALLCLVLCNPMECNPPGSSVHGIFQVRILERGAYSSGKEYACNAGDAGVMDLIPGLVRSPEEEMATCSSILAWRIPWMEEPGGLESMGSERDTPKTTGTHAAVYI